MFLITLLTLFAGTIIYVVTYMMNKDQIKSEEEVPSVKTQDKSSRSISKKQVLYMLFLANQFRVIAPINETSSLFQVYS